MRYYDLSPRKKMLGKKANVNQKKCGSNGRSYERDYEYTLKNGKYFAEVKEYYYCSEDFDGVYAAMGEDPPSHGSCSLFMNESSVNHIFAFQVGSDGVGKRISEGGSYGVSGKITFLSSQDFGEIDEKEWTEKLWLLLWYKINKLDRKYTTVGYDELCVLDDIMRSLLEDLLGADGDNEAHFLFFEIYGEENEKKNSYGWSDEWLEQIYKKTYDRMFPFEPFVIKKGLKVIESDTIPADKKAKIRAVSIPDGVEEIGISAFNGCSELEEIVLPESVKKIGDMAFAYCTALKKMVIPSKVKELPRWAFGRSNYLKEVVLPEGLEIIGSQAFDYCYGLEKINIPSTVVSIERSAFSCTAIKEITIPKGVKTINTYTFAHCKALRKINLPEGLESICGGAFASCVSLEEIVIPDSVTSLGYEVFEECSSLKTVYLPKGVVNYGSQVVFKLCSRLERVYVPNCIEEIRIGVFDRGYPKEVYFDGEKEEWIKKMRDSEYTLYFPRAIVHCKDGDVKMKGW